MQIRKYQNSGKLNDGEIHVNIDPVIITPEPWQYTLRDWNEPHKEQIYRKIYGELLKTVKNPYQDEYDQAQKEWEKLKNDEWPSNAEEIIDNMSKAIDNYGSWNPLNSIEGYYKLKEFHDNPGIELHLITYPWFDKHYWISHSMIVGNGYVPTINSQMSDKNYNLLWNNCSDATKKLIEHIKGIKMPEKWHGITTPAQVKDWVKNTFPTKSYGDTIGIPLNMTEYLKWHNYEKKKNY